MGVRLVAQDGDLFLIDTGEAVPHRRPQLTAGRVYDRTADTLAPSHGAPLPWMSYVAHGEWLDVTVDDGERHRIEQRVTALLASER